jgi:CopG family nickel-responsive transcriptional regulator
VAELTRVTVSLEADLLERFDRYCKKGRFATRSEAVRQLLHQTLTQETWEHDTAEVTATLSLVYDHHRTGLTEKLLKIQHEYPERVVASTHVHLDHDRCLEVIILRGRPSVLERFASDLRGLKGIHQGSLVLVATGGNDRHPHQHHHHSH